MLKSINVGIRSKMFSSLEYQDPPEAKMTLMLTRKVASFTIGFTGYKGRTIYPILAQPYIENATPAIPEEIDTYMTSLGFHKLEDWTYQYKNIVLSDLKPKNVLKDELGLLYVIDVEIKEIE